MQDFSLELSNEIIIIILTLVLFELVLLLFALYDWFKQGDSLDNRYIWLLLILFMSTFGPIIYFLAAPRESADKYLDEDDL